MKPDDIPTKRGPGRPKTGRTVSMAEYKQKSRDRFAAMGETDLTLRLPVQTVGLIKAMAEGTGKTRAEVIIGLVKAAHEGRWP